MMIPPSVQKKFNVYLLCFMCLMSVGCPRGSGSPTPPSAPTFTDPDPGKQEAFNKTLKCIVGKTIIIKGDYFTVFGAMIGIEREADISETLFKVKTSGDDELAGMDLEKPKVETWEAHFSGVSDGGTTGEGSNEVYCFDIEYKKGPFKGPCEKSCSIFVKARICEDCTIEDATWEIKCGFKEDGSGGQTKARGTWCIKENN